MLNNIKTTINGCTVEIDTNVKTNTKCKHVKIDNGNKILPKELAISGDDLYIESSYIFLCLDCVLELNEDLTREVIKNA